MKLPLFHLPVQRGASEKGRSSRVPGDRETRGADTFRESGAASSLPVVEEGAQ